MCHERSCVHLDTRKELQIKFKEIRDNLLKALTSQELCIRIKDPTISNSGRHVSNSNISNNIRQYHPIKRYVTLSIFPFHKFVFRQNDVRLISITILSSVTKVRYKINLVKSRPNQLISKRRYWSFNHLSFYHTKRIF